MWFGLKWCRLVCGADRFCELADYHEHENWLTEKHYNCFDPLQMSSSMFFSAVAGILPCLHTPVPVSVWGTWKSGCSRCKLQIRISSTRVPLQWDASLCNVLTYNCLLFLCLSHSWLGNWRRNVPFSPQVTFKPFLQILKRSCIRCQRMWGSVMMMMVRADPARLVHFWLIFTIVWIDWFKTFTQIHNNMNLMSRCIRVIIISVTLNFQGESLSLFWCVSGIWPVLSWLTILWKEHAYSRYLLEKEMQRLNDYSLQIMSEYIWVSVSYSSEQ